MITSKQKNSIDWATVAAGRFSFNFFPEM